MKKLIAFALVVAAAVFGCAYTPYTYQTFDVTSFGAVGDGTTINNTAFTQAFSAAANGGKVTVPCGVYKITSTPSLNIAAGKHVDFVGSGADCTVISLSGSIDGPTFNFGSQYSSAGVSDLTITSDQTGGHSCLVWNGSFTNSDPALSASSSIENVMFRGADAYSIQTEYCGVGFYESNISNISVVNAAYLGPTSMLGIGLSLNGTGVGGTYSVHVNIANSNFDACGTAVYYGDWVQGVQMTTSNVTGCGKGVLTAATPSGTLSGLLISSSQFDTFTSGVNVADANFANLQLSNNQWVIEPNSTGVKVQGSNFAIDGDNEFNGHTTTGNTGISVLSTFGNGGKIGGHFAGLNSAIGVSAASTASLKIEDTLFSNNTTNYSINASASGVVISDTNPTVLASIPTCNSATKYSKYSIANSGTNSFMGIIAGTGLYIGTAVCDGSNLVFH